MNRHNDNASTRAHLESLRRFPANAVALQKDFNKRRMVRALKGRAVRPIFIPQQFDFTAAGPSSTPVSGKTPSSANPGTPQFDKPIDVLALCDDFHRNANAANVIGLELTINREQSLGLVDPASVFITNDAFSGNGPFAGGQYLPAPLPLEPGERLFFGAFSNGVGGNLSRTLVAIGQTLIPSDSPEAQLRLAELEAAQVAINKRRVPQSRVMAIRVNYPAAAQGSVVEAALPNRSEPVLIRGFRSQGMIESTVEIGIRNGYQLTSGPVPVWALAACGIPLSTSNLDAEWQLLETPFYLSAGVDFVGKFTSSSPSTPAGKYDNDAFGAVPVEYAAADVTHIQQALTLEVLTETL